MYLEICLHLSLQMPRKQLKYAEKVELRRLIGQDGSDRQLHNLVSDWNSRAAEHSCPIDYQYLSRIRATLPKSPVQLWETVKSEVEATIARPDSLSQYEPPVLGYDYEGLMTEPVDADKVPWASEAQIESIRFDFENPRYNKADSDNGNAGNNKAFKADFRKHLQSRGMVFGAFSSFISQDEHARDPDILSKACPSSTNGPWNTVAGAVQEDKSFRSKCRREGATFAKCGTTEDRINPNFNVLKSHYIDIDAEKLPEGEKERRGGFRAAFLQVLCKCEAVFRSIASWLPTCQRKDSHGKKYAIPLELDPSNFSLLSCLSKKTKVQMEHMDDNAPGVSALWGLFPNQYVIVWWFSYEMNRELEELSSDFYDFVMKQPRPSVWSEAAFWNLVADLCLKMKGFHTCRKPTPVKVPLPVGKLLLMDFLVVHAGMPFVQGEASLRGHMYWAQVAGRGGESASMSTCFLWSTYHKLYPSWRILSQGRRVYE